MAHFGKSTRPGWVDKKYGWSQDGRFFTQTCIISQIVMINGVFDDFWKITHLSLMSILLYNILINLWFRMWFGSQMTSFEMSHGISQSFEYWARKDGFVNNVTGIDTFNMQSKLWRCQCPGHALIGSYITHEPIFARFRPRLNGQYFDSGDNNKLIQPLRRTPTYGIMSLAYYETHL